MLEQIGGDAAPQQLHGAARAIGAGDAGPPELQDPAGMGLDLGDVVFAGGVEGADPGRPVAPDQPVGADHALDALAARMVDHQQVVGHVVIGVEVPAGGGHFGRGLGRHLLVEDGIAQLLGRPNLLLRLGQPDLEIACAQAESVVIDEGCDCHAASVRSNSPGAPRRFSCHRTRRSPNYKAERLQMCADFAAGRPAGSRKPGGPPGDGPPRFEVSPAGRGCRGRSAWPACCAAWRSSAPPSDSRPAGPSAPDTRPGSCCRPSSDAASASSAACRPRDR